MSRCTYCGGDHRPEDWILDSCPQRARRAVIKILVANLAIILACAAWLMLAGCGGGLRVEFPPKQQVEAIPQIEQVAAVAAQIAKAPAAPESPSSDPWKSQAVWAGAATLVAYPIGRLIRTRLLNPTQTPKE